MIFGKGEFFKCCAVSSNLPESSLPEVVFVGKSNVGKSSIINKLLNRKNLARVSSKQGKTSTINFYKVDKFFIVDLPGYGFAKVSKSERQRWVGLTESYFFSNRLICLVVLIVDCRRSFSNFDLEMVEFCLNKGLNFVVVLNKVDRMLKKDLENLKLEILNSFSSFLKEDILIGFSAKTLEGLAVLKEKISSFVV